MSEAESKEFFCPKPTQMVCFVDGTVSVGVKARKGVPIYSAVAVPDLKE
jgi:hypothetical protein